MMFFYRLNFSVRWREGNESNNSARWDGFCLKQELLQDNFHYADMMKDNINSLFFYTFFKLWYKQVWPTYVGIISSSMLLSKHLGWEMGDGMIVTDQQEHISVCFWNFTWSLVRSWSEHSLLHNLYRTKSCWCIQRWDKIYLSGCIFTYPKCGLPFWASAGTGMYLTL